MAEKSDRTPRLAWLGPMIFLITHLAQPLAVWHK